MSAKSRGGSREGPAPEIVFLAQTLQTCLLALTLLSREELDELNTMLSMVDRRERCPACGLSPCLEDQVRLLLWTSLLEGLVRVRELVSESFDYFPEELKERMREQQRRSWF